MSTGDRKELGPEELERLRVGVRAIALRALEDPDDAEDVAQETMSRTIQALREGRFQRDRSLGAFVRGIARHVIADALRARGRTSRLRAVGDPFRRRPGDGLTALVSREEQDRLHEALQQLSDSDRELLRLSFFDGLTPAQIAERWGEPSERIRKRKSRALMRLREAFFGGAPTGHDSA